MPCTCSTRVGPVPFITTRDFLPPALKKKNRDAQIAAIAQCLSEQKHINVDPLELENERTNFVLEDLKNVNGEELELQTETTGSVEQSETEDFVQDLELKEDDDDNVEPLISNEVVDDEEDLELKEDDDNVEPLLSNEVVDDDVDLYNLGESNSPVEEEQIEDEDDTKTTIDIKAERANASAVLKSLDKHQKPSDVQIRKLILAAAFVLSLENNVLELQSPVIVVGDIHGQWDDLEKVFSNIEISSGLRVLFLGDYVDRGLYSIECLARLLSLKILHPDFIFLLRGNHEDTDSNDVYGLAKECAMFYSEETYNTITRYLWPALPLCAVIDEKLFCVHGGIPTISSPEDARKKLNEIRIFPRKTLGPSPTRFALSPYTSPSLRRWVNVVQNLLWSDPSIDGVYTKKLFSNSERGMGKVWNEKATTMWNEANGFTHIIRGHQAVSKGIFYSHGKKVITVFSASLYCGGGNAASLLKVWSPSSFERITWKVSPTAGLFGKKVLFTNNSYFM